VFSALRWFVDPYDPDLIYMLDFQGVKVSPHGDQTWFFDRDDNYGDGWWQASGLVFGGTGHAVLQGRAADAILIRNGRAYAARWISVPRGFRCSIQSRCRDVLNQVFLIPFRPHGPCTVRRVRRTQHSAGWRTTAVASIPAAATHTVNSGASTLKLEQTSRSRTCPRWKSLSSRSRPASTPDNSSAANRSATSLQCAHPSLFHQLRMPISRTPK
jgi:hypothetical protein